MGKSDHVVLSWHYKYESIPNNSKSHTRERARYNFKKSRYKEIGRYLEGSSWKMDSEMDVETMWSCRYHVIMKAIKEHVPLVKVGRLQNKSAPWWTNKLLKEVKLKHALWKDYQRDKSAATYHLYTRQRNRTSQCVNKARKMYENKLSANCKHEPKKLHMYIRSQLKIKPQIRGLETASEELSEDNQQAAEVLNDFFHSVFTTEGTDQLPEFPDLVDDNCALTDIQLSEEDVYNQLQKLQEGKAAGPDDIPSIFLKRCAVQLTKPLTMLFRRSIQLGRLPKVWKMARISPIFKKGSMRKPENYRPVSLTSQLCKILERLILEHVIHHLTRNNLLSDQQHGFTKGRSCQTNLLEALEEWTRWLDEGKSVDIIYLDYQKAFDKVPHRRLIKKLSAYGVRGQVLEWIQDFLTDRTQQVMVGQSTSRVTSVTSGVPQGSVLGPMLFIIYINELPKLVQSKCKLFADDTKLFHRISTDSDCKVLQLDLDKLMEWSLKWLLQFNIDKCKVMHCGHANPSYEYIMKDPCKADKALKKTDLERDLGVLISNDLKATAHCQAAAKKAMVALRQLKMAFSEINKVNFKALYTTYVRPHLDYCLSAVGPHMARDIKKLEQVQRRATKLVREIRSFSYEERLQELDLISMKDRAIRGDLIETYKLLTKKLTIDPNQLFKLQDNTRTRGHHLKLTRTRAAHHFRAKFFSNRVVTLWNKLPAQVISATTVESFKNRLDRHWATNSSFV